jgi:type IV secretory pathway TraG/TraD family ATPase VirD4
MLALIMDAIQAGRGVLVVDPKTDLVNDVLARIPQSRADDVVVIDPTDPRPVGINPLRRTGRHLALTADSMLAVFKELSGDSWGPRTEDVLLSALMTLARHDGATLTMLPPLLTDEKFRRSLIRNIDDQLGLGSFWASYEAMNPQQRAQVIAPTMSRLRQFLLRPQLRAVLGQSHPEFDLTQLFTQRKIVLVSLNRGQIGTESARLLGSLIVSQLWPLILARAALPQERRYVVNVFIDEVQDYLALPTDLEDAFSQARSLGVGFAIAHQYRKQLPPSLRSGVDANARNKIIFGLNAEDASDLAKQAPELDTQDFMYLPRFGVYTTLIQDGSSTGWFSARTLPADSPTSDPVEMRARSAQKYGRDILDVEAEIRGQTGSTSDSASTANPDGAIGRRNVKRSS